MDHSTWQSSLFPSASCPISPAHRLHLENSKGTVQLAIAQTKKNDYKFTIDLGTGKYTSTSSSGTMKLHRLTPRSIW